MQSKRIMFICHGNICRSPMAEFIFKKLVADKNLSDYFIINSCATSTEEIGNSIYPPAKRELTKMGVPFTDHRSVQLKKSDYESYDMFVVMDSANYRNTLRIFGEDKQNKVSTLLSHAGQNRDVSDPWYTGDFTTCYNDILLGCTAILNKILG